MTDHSPDHAERAAQKMLADRGRFPSGGAVPFDVARSLIAAALRGRDAVVEAMEAKITALEDRGGKAVIAYHVAICSPKGVVPDDELYDPVLATTIQAAIDAGIPTRAALDDTVREGEG